MSHFKPPMRPALFCSLGFLPFFLSIFTTAANAQYPIASPTDANYPFYHGVASGDALSDRVIIWTRVSGEDAVTSVEVNYTLSTSADMSSIAHSGTFTTDAERDFTVKIDVTGLEADTWYYYQFEALDGLSPIGRTKTLPLTMVDVADFRFALASCANYEGGYFNAYGDIAARNDLDAVFQVGDYIYEYGGGTYGNGIRYHLPNLEVITLEEYRARHSNYKLDEDLAAAHRQYPWYMSWDDHETVNNSYATGAENHDPETEGEWIARRNAALQAYYEWNPVRDITFSETSVPAYRSIEVGNLAKFYILETRLNARSPEVPLPNVELLYADPAAYFTDPANLMGIYTSNTAAADTTRTMLGQDQKTWLTSEFASSEAQWNVVVNQTVMAGLPIADLTEPVEALGGASIADVFAQQTGGLDIGSAVFLSYDNWDGFAADRAWLYGTMQALGVSNPVVLTGDIHSSWANTLVDFLNPTETVGVEFVTTQIAGDVRSFGQPNEAVEALLPWVEYFNQVCNGYTVIDLDATRAQADYVIIQSTLGNLVAWNNTDGNTGIEDRENFVSVVDGSFLSFADSYRPIVAPTFGLDTLPRSILEAPAVLPDSENSAPLADDLEAEDEAGNGCGLFFSGYAEGSSNNKFLEIYNPTDAAVDLADFAFPNVSNAPSTPGEYEFWNAFPEGAVIEANGVYVIAHPDADSSIVAEADMTFQYLSNGDDGFGLVQGTENDFVILDMIGNWDEDPGSGWDVAGTSNGTKEHALIRKPEITAGNGGEWFASAGTTPEDSEWIVLERDDWTGLGSHDFSGECGASPADGPFTMQIFHNNDTESNLLNADNFGYLLNSMRSEADDAGIPHITLHSGDITLPGISTNLFAASGFSSSLDAIALDYLDYDALCIGNHEFDLCPDALASFIGLFPNSEPPFLNINLDFSEEPAMAALVELGRVVNSTVLDVAGQEVAVIGLVTPDLEAVTCIGETQVLTNLAELLQAEVDELTAQGINKIIVASHLQGLIAPEADGEGDYAVASAITGVDVWIAGGGGNMLHNGEDIGDYQLDGPYPLITQDASGADLPIITTVSSFSYLGALRVTFDENGVVTDLHDGFSNTYAIDLSDDAPVDDFLYQNVVSEIEAIIAQAEVVGYSEIDWDLRDAVIRSRESGFGNLVADAFLASGIAYAESNADVDAPVVAITNGGGLRTDFHWLTTASPEAPEEVTNVLIGEILPFDNTIAVVEDVTTANLKLILENCVSQTVFDPTTGGVIADDGRFGHISGMWFEYDIFGESYEPDAQGNALVEGTRVLNAYLDDGTALIVDGVPVEGLTIDVATNSFLATGGPAFSGGDYYPFEQVNADAIHVGDELYAQTLVNFITALSDSLVSAATYPSLPGYDEGRIRVVLPVCDDPNGCTYGCTNIAACNYDETASSDDGSCEFAEDNLNCDGTCVNDDDMDGVCNENEVAGCTDALACNYSSAATDDDGTCTYTGAGCSEPECDLFISEYGVGSGSNRWVEIYNPTGFDVNLDDYAWPNVSNSNNFPGSYEYWNGFNDGHILAAGDVYVLAHPDADAAILAEADQTFPYMPDGNAGFALVSGTADNFVIIDMFANFEGDNDGIGFWSVCGDSTVTTNNVTLVRNAAFQGNPNPSGEDLTSEDGTTVFTAGSLAAGVCEWDIYAADDFSHIGGHTYSGSCEAPEVPSCELGVVYVSESHTSGDPEDYIEIYNSGATCMLTGFQLDDNTALEDFTFGEVVIEAGGYWLGYEDDENSFSSGLSSGGDIVVLADPAGNMLIVDAGPSVGDLSVSYDADGVGCYTTPTPGEANASCGTFGCTDELACNYDAEAVADDSSCTYSDGITDCDGACINDADNDGICDENEDVEGCTDPAAENFNPNATVEDGSCWLSNVSAEAMGSYQTGIWDAGAAEIVDYHAGTQRLFFVNAAEASVQALDMSSPDSLTFLFSMDATEYGASANGLVVFGDYVAVAIEAAEVGVAGNVVIYDVEGNFVSSSPAGFLPDAITISNDGMTLAVSNEGQPNDTYTVDPVGSVTLVDVSNPQAPVSVQVGFESITSDMLDESVRIFGPGASIAQDLEPEYAAFNSSDSKLYVSCQENNCMVVIDMATQSVEDIWGLGFKDHSLPGNALDASNQDGTINITNWPVKGMYQPDAIHAYEAGGIEYLVLANEGDARDYDSWSEEDRVRDLVLDSIAFPDAATLQLNENLGRLKTTTTMGDTDGDGDYDEIYSYGARSFSIFTTDGQLVYDSGDDFEQITAELLPLDFNSTNDSNGSFDNRSDDKGPEPEGIDIGTMNGRTYAFIGLERVSGVMVYDITDPAAPQYERYLSNRDFSIPDGDLVANPGAAGDLGPEGLVFISAEDSPNGIPYLVTSNEISGTLTAYALDSSAEYQPCSLDNVYISEGHTSGEPEDYIELYNDGDYPCSLEGFMLDDNTALTDLTFEEVIIEAGGFWLGYEDAEGSFGSGLSSGGDIIVLGDPNGEIRLVTLMPSLGEYSQSFDYYGNGCYTVPTPGEDNEPCEDTGVYTLDDMGCTYEGACNYDPTALFDDGSCVYLAGDLNGDGFVTSTDLLSFLANFAQSCD